MSFSDTEYGNHEILCMLGTNWNGAWKSCSLAHKDVAVSVASRECPFC